MWLTLSLFLVILCFLIKLRKIIRAGNLSHSPPGPPSLPIIGNLHQLGSLPHHSLAQLSRRYGHVMFLRFGSVPAIVVSSAEAAKEVLKIHDLECCNRPLFAGPKKLSYNYVDLGFSPYNEHYREIRKICALNLFSKKRVDSFRFIRMEEVSSLIGSLRTISPDHAVDLSEKLIALTTSMTFWIAFGTRLDIDGFHKIIHSAHVALGRFAASDFLPYLGWIIDRLTGLHAKFEKSFNELDDFFNRVIDDHLNRSLTQEEEDFVDVMLRIEKEQSELGKFQFTKDCIKAILMNIFMAGVDSPGTTMIWAMSELARNPRVMKKAQAEVRSLCIQKGKLVSESDIDGLKYLKMIVKETLRLHPPAPLLIPRDAISQFNLAGYQIYPKTMIQVNVWAIGRDPKYWDKPEEFFPERFTDSSIDYKGQHHFEFLPVGAGRRICPGVYMGMSTIELALANLLYCFDWKSPEGETDIDMDEAFGIACYKKSALKLVPISYQWSLEN